jgi:hypothetical protein
MRPLGFIVLIVLSALAPGRAPAAEEKVDFEVHRGYLLKTKFYLAARAADKTGFGYSFFWTFRDKDSFDKAFGKTKSKVDLSTFMPSGDKAKPNLLSRDAFDKKMVVAMSHNSMNIYRFKVKKVTADGGTLYVRYSASSTPGYPNSYACPLLVAVNKGKYTSVVFIENGKKIGTAAITKKK